MTPIGAGHPCSKDEFLCPLEKIPCAGGKNSLPRSGRQFEGLRATHGNSGVPVEGLRKLKRSQLLRGNQLPRKGPELVTVYFDTQRLKLRKKSVSLRVRHVGGQHLQTIKRNDPGNGAALSRNEWETDIDGGISILRPPRGRRLNRC